MNDPLADLFVDREGFLIVSPKALADQLRANRDRVISALLHGNAPLEVTDEARHLILESLGGAPWQTLPMSGRLWLFPLEGDYPVTRSSGPGSLACGEDQT